MKVILVFIDFNIVNFYENFFYCFVLVDFFFNIEVILLIIEVWEEYLVLFYYFLCGWLVFSF